MFQIVLLAIIFAIVALNVNKGLWRNLITLINVLFAALLAMNYFEPAAEFLKSKDVTFDFMVDLLAAWGIFAAAMLLLRVVTDRLTKIRVRFIKPVDLGVGIFFSMWSGWIVACFAAVTLHVAPLPRRHRGIAASFQFHSLPGSPLVGLYASAVVSGARPRGFLRGFRLRLRPKGDFLLRYGRPSGRLEKLKEKNPETTFKFLQGRNTSL